MQSLTMMDYEDMMDIISSLGYDGNCHYDGYQRALAIMVYKFLDKKNSIGNKCKWTASWRMT